MAAGNLVSDEIVLGMLEDRFQQSDTANGFILDGYPRNLAQASALDGLLTRIRQPMDIAVQLDVATDLLVERIAGRAAAEGRADDSPEAVRNRLKVYDELTAPVVDFYRNQGKLAHLDGVGQPDDVFTRRQFGSCAEPVPSDRQPFW
jgi:adenylate kinase